MKFLSMDICDWKIECLGLVMQCLIVLKVVNYVEVVCDWKIKCLELVMHCPLLDCFRSGELCGSSY